MSHRVWSDEEHRRLMAMADMRLDGAVIAAALERSHGAVRKRAMLFGITLDRHRIKHEPKPADVAAWSAADKIEMWANVPQELAELVVAGADLFRVSVRWLRSESRDAELVKCRRWITAQARDRGFSFPLIGRALNRDHSTIMYHAERVDA